MAAERAQRQAALETRRAAAADELARADAARQAEFQARAERLERERVQGMLLVVFVSFCCSFWYVFFIFLLALEALEEEKERAAAALLEEQRRQANARADAEKKAKLEADRVSWKIFFVIPTKLKILLSEKPK